MFDVSGDAGASSILLSLCYIYPAKRDRSARLNITQEVPYIRACLSPPFLPLRHALWIPLEEESEVEGAEGG